MASKSYSARQIGGCVMPGSAEGDQNQAFEGLPPVLVYVARMDSRGIGWYFMQRQCAWCLRLMDRFGDPISAPQPKLYEVSHGMCWICGSLWLEQAVRDTNEQEARKKQVPLSEVEER